MGPSAGGRSSPVHAVVRCSLLLFLEWWCVGWQSVVVVCVCHSLSVSAGVCVTVSAGVCVCHCQSVAVSRLLASVSVSGSRLVRTLSRRVV